MDVRSQLISTLLANIDEDRKLTVLDVGPARSETVEFFSQFKCRIYFVDFFADEVLALQKQDLSGDELRDQFLALFDFPPGTVFDICLFWDLLVYLDQASLSIFSQALTPFLSSATGIHGFSTLKASTKLPFQQFSVKQVNGLGIVPRDGDQPPYHPHSQTQLNKTLSGIEIAKSTLLANGLLEMLFKVTD